MIGELVDEQQIGHQQGIGQAGNERQGVEAAALHVVAAHHHQQPARGDGQFAQAAAHQAQRRCRIRPAREQATGANGEQAGPGVPAQPQPGRNHQREQAVAEAGGLAQREHAVLDEAAAAGKGEQTLGVERIGAAQAVVIVVDDVHAGMGEQGEQHGHQGRHCIQREAGAVSRGQAEHAGHQRHRQEGGSGGGKVAHEDAGVARGAGLKGQWGAHRRCACEGWAEWSAAGFTAARCRIVPGCSWPRHGARSS